MDNKVKETVWKLIHRKLYSEDVDGGVRVIFFTDFAKDTWKAISNLWTKWTTETLRCDP